MLGNGDGNGGDAIDELLGRIAEGARGVDDTDSGNGSGNNGHGGGNSGGDNGGGDGDPMGRPIDGRTLISALRQVADLIRMTTERQSDLTMRTAETSLKAVETERDAMLATAKQLHENTMALSEVNVRLAHAAGDRFEALEARLCAVESDLARLRAANAGASEDVGSGP